MHYPVLAPSLFVFLVGIFIVVVVLIEIRVLRYAYLRIGVSSRVVLFLLFSSLFGSYINVPVAHFPDRAGPGNVCTRSSSNGPAP
jgi:uncharacterized membrane protein